MPKRFEDIYHYREGSDKFFFDKLTEITDTTNSLIVDSKSTVSFTVKDDTGAGVSGAKVKITSGSNTFTTSETGSAGGANLQNVPYGVYTVTVIAPTGYTSLAKYDNLTVNSVTTTLEVTVNKN